MPLADEARALTDAATRSPLVQEQKAAITANIRQRAKEGYTSLDVAFFTTNPAEVAHLVAWLKTEGFGVLPADGHGKTWEVTW